MHSRIASFDAEPRAASKACRRGLALIELLVVIGVIGILFALSFPAVQSARASAQRAACANNLRQLAAAMSSYDASHGSYPCLYHGLFGDRDVKLFAMHYSIQTHLLPFLEEGATYDQINFEADEHESGAWRPLRRNVTAARRTIATFLCPADAEEAYDGLGGLNFPANRGTTAFEQAERPFPSHRVGNGAEVNFKSLRTQDFKDGLTTTAFFSEKPRGSGGKAFRPFVGFHRANQTFYSLDELVAMCAVASRSPGPFQNQVRYSWQLSGLRFASYNHNLTPNNSIPDCKGRGDGNLDLPLEGSFSARSYHPGGVNVVFGDGHVRFVSQSIALDHWRALGTRNGGETAAGDL